jgi:hypothetical protein
MRPRWPIAFRPAAAYAGGTPLMAVAVGDLDGDGRPDLAAAKDIGGGVAVFLNRGDGTFGAALPVAVGLGVPSTAIAIGDLDGDGKNDLVVANQNGGVLSVLLNRGGGAFAGSVQYAAGNEAGMYGSRRRAVAGRGGR